MKYNDNAAETLLKTDKAIFYYVWQEMKKQNAKSVDTWFDEETGGEMPGDENKYFGWSSDNNHAARCALGFIMNRGIAEDYDVEEKDASDNDVLATIIESNPEWNFTSSSAKLVMLLQLIHDQYPVYSWNKAFELYQKDFDENGRFTGLDDMEYVNEGEVEIHVKNRSLVLDSFPACAVRDMIRNRMDGINSTNNDECEAPKDILSQVLSEVSSEKKEELV